jgi:hypothetical protein
MMNAVETWVMAGERGDADAARAALADDVVLVSPVTDQFTFDGADEVVGLLRDVFDVVSKIQYVRVERTSSGAVLLAEARVGEVTMNEAQFIDLDPDGLITRLTLFFRPLTASTHFLRELGPRVARRQGRPAAARTLSLAGAFLDSVASSGDRTFIPIAAPSRGRRG